LPGKGWGWLKHPIEIRLRDTARTYGFQWEESSGLYSRGTVAGFVLALAYFPEMDLVYCAVNSPHGYAFITAEDLGPIDAELFPCIYQDECPALGVWTAR
jgi:hypothetical protein